jgi:hypothetical protein
MSQSEARVSFGLQNVIYASDVIYAFLEHNVVAERREAASPEIITTKLSNKIAAQDYESRAPAFGQPRNDALRIGEREVIYGK